MTQTRNPHFCEGWQLVPIEPSTNMVIDGFEAVSEFRDSEECAAMSGCQASSEAARICYRTMLASAPSAPLVAVSDNKTVSDLHGYFLHYDPKAPASSYVDMNEKLQYWAEQDNFKTVSLAGQVAPQATDDIEYSCRAAWEYMAGEGSTGIISYDGFRAIWLAGRRSAAPSTIKAEPTGGQHD